MTEQRKTEAFVTSNLEIAPDIYSMWIKEEKMAASARAGQFVSLYSRDGSRLLPRPISICEINREDGLLRLVYRVVGSGTKEFSTYGSGSRISVMGPLGNGFTPEGGKAVLLGGGIGIPPMLELAKSLRGSSYVTAVLGYRDGETFLAEEFAPYATVVIATEDGSTGVRGNVLDALKEKKLAADILYACGPLPMLKGVRQYALDNGITAQISMEERMACGIGACLACVCKSKETDAHTHVKNKRICKDGPVFYAREVEL